jgi:hypothetical protein
MLAQAALTDMEVVVSASQSFANLKDEDMQKIVQWAGLYAQNPTLAIVIARQGGIPMSLVSQIASGAYNPAQESPQENPMEVPQAIAERMGMGGMEPPNGMANGLGGPFNG